MGAWMKREASQNAGCSHRYPRPPQLKSWELPTRLRLSVAFGASLPLWHRISDLQVQVTTQEAAQTSRSPMKSAERQPREVWRDRKSTRLNSSHVKISYAVFCLKKKKNKKKNNEMTK